MGHEVLEADFPAHTVRVKDLSTGEIFEDRYDRLILATGSWPIVPKIPGTDLRGVHLCKLYQHAQEILAEVFGIGHSEVKEMISSRFQAGGEAKQEDGRWPQELWVDV